MIIRIFFHNYIFVFTFIEMSKCRNLVRNYILYFILNIQIANKQKEEKYKIFIYLPYYYIFIIY